MRASFVERFGFKKQENSTNSKHQAIVLDEIGKLQEEMAPTISQANSSPDNVTNILTQALTSEHSTPSMKGEEEEHLEQEIEAHSLETLLKRLEQATSPEALSVLLEEYGSLLSKWKEKIVLLRGEKYLKEYFAIHAALNLLQQMMQHTQLLNGKIITEQLQQGVKAQQQSINDQVQRMLQQNQKLHTERQALARQLTQYEQSLRSVIEAFKKNPGELSPKEQQAYLKQLEEALKQIQAMKDAITKGKPVDLQQITKNLERIQQQNQKMLENGRLSDTVINALKQSQQIFQQNLQQIQKVNQLQESIVQQMQQIRKNILNSIQQQSAVTDKIQYLKQNTIINMADRQSQRIDLTQKDLLNQKIISSQRIDPELNQRISNNIMQTNNAKEIAARQSVLLQQQMERQSVRYEASNMNQRSTIAATLETKSWVDTISNSGKVREEVAAKPSGEQVASANISKDFIQYSTSIQPDTTKLSQQELVTPVSNEKQNLITTQLSVKTEQLAAQQSTQILPGSIASENVRNYTDNTSLPEKDRPVSEERYKANIERVRQRASESVGKFTQTIAETRCKCKEETTLVI